MTSAYSTDSYHTYHIDLPEEADRIIRQECSLAEAHPLATIEEIQHTAILLFAEYLDAATSMATSSGGGGNSDSNGWGRNKDEDDREWTLRRVLQETNVLSGKVASTTGMSSGVKNVGPQRNQVGFIKTNTNKGPTDSYVAMPEMSKKGPKVGRMDCNYDL